MIPDKGIGESGLVARGPQSLDRVSRATLDPPFHPEHQPVSNPHPHHVPRLFPDSIFGRKLGDAAEKRLRLAQARAEEAIIRAHVDNALMFVDALTEDMSFDRAIDTYIRVMGVPEPMAGVIATRALVILGDELVPYRRRQRDGEERPEVRLGREED